MMNMSARLSWNLLWIACLFCFLNSAAKAFVPSLPLPHRRHASADADAAPAMAPFHRTTSCAVSASASSSSSAAAVSLPCRHQQRAEAERRAWFDRSIQYYSKVMREERRRALGQLPATTSTTTMLVSNNNNNDDDFHHLAKKHYFALRKIKDGKPEHAELIYRRILDELLHEQEHCDHAKLAVTTLLLALLLQGRCGASVKQTRSVFLHFFRLVRDSHDECACSAKVLQAFALFEMKQGHALKSLFLVRKAVQLDPTLRPVLKWKLFRDAGAALNRQQGPYNQGSLSDHAFVAP